jgi:hypothetical protein
VARCDHQPNKRSGQADKRVAPLDRGDRCRGFKRDRGDLHCEFPASSKIWSRDVYDLVARTTHALVSDAFAVGGQ